MALARSHTRLPIETLAEIMQNGWGRASQNLHHAGGIDVNWVEKLDAAIKRAKEYDARRERR